MATAFTTKLSKAQFAGNLVRSEKIKIKCTYTKHTLEEEIMNLTNLTYNHLIFGYYSDR